MPPFTLSFKGNRGGAAFFNLLLVDMDCHIRPTPPLIHCICARTLESSSKRGGETCF